MNPFAVSGYDENNIRFSNCSIASMRRTLSQRAEECFGEAPTSLCGNGVLEQGEECDEGLIIPGEKGECCTRNCRLVAGAKCTPRNHVCCTDKCDFKPRNEVCSQSNFLQCRMESRCTGNSGLCPEPRPTPDGSLCVDWGECSGGKCNPFCERIAIGKKACMCSEAEFACRRCCRAVNSSICSPEPTGDVLSDGTFCTQGTCKNAVCVRVEVDFIKHVWSVLESIDRSNFWDFIKTNIVAIIVFLSLFMWCPLSVIICNWDRRSAKARAPPALKRVEAKFPISALTNQTIFS